MGAWIEISMSAMGASLSKSSLPSWERGLKFAEYKGLDISGLSLPSWERGLKYRTNDEI